MIEKIENKTIDDIYNDIDLYVQKFLDDGILFFKNLFLSEENQLNLFKTIGEKANFKPENKTDIEDHKNTFDRYQKTILENEIFIEWHLENIQQENPQVAASWSMEKCECPTTSGKTFCVNMSDFYLNLPDKWKSFLEHLTIEINIENDNNGVVFVDKNIQEKNIKPVVQEHYLNKNKVLRIPFYEEDYKPYQYNGCELTEDDLNVFTEIKDYIQKNITDNLDSNNYISWEKGDLVIIDLFTIAHAVSGGFNIGERIFSRIWGYNK